MGQKSSRKCFPGALRLYIFDEFAEERDTEDKNNHGRHGVAGASVRPYHAVHDIHQKIEWEHHGDYSEILNRHAESKLRCSENLHKGLGYGETEDSEYDADNGGCCNAGADTFVGAVAVVHTGAYAEV